MRELDKLDKWKANTKNTIATDGKDEYKNKGATDYTDEHGWNAIVWTWICRIEVSTAHRNS